MGTSQSQISLRSKVASVLFIVSALITVSAFTWKVIKNQIHHRTEYSVALGESESLILWTGQKLNSAEPGDLTVERQAEGRTIFKAGNGIQDLMLGDPEDFIGYIRPCQLPTFAICHVGHVYAVTCSDGRHTALVRVSKYIPRPLTAVLDVLVDK